MKLIFTIVLAAAMSLNINAKVISATRLDEGFLTGGKLNEKLYKTAPQVTELTERDPDEGKAATRKTEIWTAYDESNLYFCAKFYENNKGEIERSIARRDNYFDSDWFIVYLDPYLDKKTGNFFAVNAGGSIIDGTIYEDSNIDYSWDGIWDAKTEITSYGWKVEMKIPFSQLRFKYSKSMQFGINFERRRKINLERDLMIMVPKKESGLASKFGILTGLNEVKEPKRLEIMPYIVQKAGFLKHDAQDPFYKSHQYRTTFGGDIKLGLGTNLNLDACINPDFGQVEVDPAVINLSAGETFYDEKRPFFLEGLNIFSFGSGGINNHWNFNFGTPNLFYTRRIGAAPHGKIDSNVNYSDCPGETKILGAAKLTGKLDGNWSLGAASAVTEKTFANLDSSNLRKTQLMEPLTHYGIFRIMKETEDGNKSIGFMFTGVNRNLSTKDQSTSDIGSRVAQQAYVFGTDGYYIFGENSQWAMSFAGAGSFNKGSKDYMTELQQRSYRYYQRPDATRNRLDSSMTSMSGWYGRLELNKQKGSWYLNSSLGAASPGFEFNDLGSQWFSGRINYATVAGYRWYNPDSTFRSKQLYVSHSLSTDFEGNVTANFLMLFANAEFLNYWGFNSQAGYILPATSTSMTRGGPIVKTRAEIDLNASLYSDSRKSTTGDLYGNFNRNENGYNYFNLGFDLTYKPMPKLNISVGPSFEANHDPHQWIDSFDDLYAIQTYKKRYVFGLIDQKTISANIRMNWTFNPRLSLQLYLQPLFSVGKYSSYKELSMPGTSDYRVYDSVELDRKTNKVKIDPDGNGPAESFSFDNPDFNTKSIRGNIILRWELMPGSILFFAWTHEQTNDQNAGEMHLGRDFKNIWEAKPDNLYMIKFNYRFDI